MLRLQYPILQISAALALASQSLADSAAHRPFSRDVVPFLQQYCFDCHSGDGAEAGVDLSLRTTQQDARAEPARWNQVRGLIQLKAMPPADHDLQPTDEERVAVVRRIDELVNRVDCGGPLSPGDITMRRLNSFEYDNTIRDLFGVEILPSEFVGLPSDDIGNGFDNQGEVLSLSPLQIEKYLDAAEEITKRVLNAMDERTEDSPEPANESEDKSQNGYTPIQQLLAAAPDEGVASRDAAEAFFKAFLPRVYRRPVESEEVDQFVRLAKSAWESGASYKDGVAVGVQAALVSPHFLFLVEPTVESASPALLADHELACRLSYFLWASMPDRALFDLATQGGLNDPGALERQVQRMLKSPAADTLVSRFMGQWLGVTGMDHLSPDPEQFPLWNTRLSEAVQEETFRFCRAMLREDRGLLELFDADFTYMNPRLADLYDVTFLGEDPWDLYLEGPGAPDRKRRERRRTRDGLYKLEDRWVRTPAPQGRRGVTMHASVLAHTSNPTETSPVKRGRWVLDVVLGAPPPPAPPSVPSLEETANDLRDRPLREQLAVHRSNPSCAGCHEKMDPIGFGLQNFDAIGRWRDHEHGRPIDASGSFEGESFAGPTDLLRVIRAKEDQIAQNFVRRLLTYALGRGLRPEDQCAVEKIVQDAKPQRYKLSSLIVGVVLSDPFRKHPGATPETPVAALNPEERL